MEENYITEIDEAEMDELSPIESDINETTGRVNYINNKEFMYEINRSKMTFCSYVDDKYSTYDAIVASLDSIDSEYIETVRARKAQLMTQAARAALRAAGAKASALKDATVAPESIPTEDLVFRLMTSAHVPLDPNRKRKGKGENANHTRTPFLPFKHFIIQNGQFVEVLRSHWKGDFLTGEFEKEGGHMTKRLADMFIILVDRYSRRSNWRGYTYLEEMKSHALLQLSQIGLQFNEAVSDNPFAFYTTTIKNCLSGDTEILTREYGAIAIEKVSGKDVHLLDGDGNWVECRVFDHGKQETYEHVFTQGRQKVVIRSTANHGWISSGERAYETSEFAVNNQTKIDNLRPQKIISNQDAYRKGVVHGIFYGDGSKAPGASSTKFFMRVCKNKTSLVNWLTECRVTKPDSYEGDSVYHIDSSWCDLKALPVEPGANTDYLLGFIRGWLATDGCVASANQVVSICGDAEEAEWLRTWAPVVGFQIGKTHPLATETNFGKRNKASMNVHIFKKSVSSEDLLNARHSERWADTTHTLQWSVYKRNFDPSKTRIENVYCPIVRTTSSFALASGIHSSNCFTRILNLEKKNQNMRDDILVMNGASPSYTRQNDEDYARGLARHNAATGNGPTLVVRMAMAAAKAKAKAEAEDDSDAVDNLDI